MDEGIIENILIEEGKENKMREGENLTLFIETIIFVHYIGGEGSKSKNVCIIYKI